MVTVAPSGTVSEKFRNAQSFKYFSVMVVRRKAQGPVVFTNDSSRHLNPRSNLLAHDRVARTKRRAGERTVGAIGR
jgi:hypothetical protein